MMMITTILYCLHAVLDHHIESYLWQPACISQAETMVIAEKIEFMCGLNRRSQAFLLCAKIPPIPALPVRSYAVMLKAQQLHVHISTCMFQETLKILPFGSDVSSVPSKHIMVQNAVFLEHTGHYKLHASFLSSYSVCGLIR
jgi:hypothetical protein